MIKSYLVVTTEHTLIVKAESEIEAATEALHYHDDPMRVRVITVQDVDTLPLVTAL